MGSATREALAQLRVGLRGAGAVTQATVDELFSVARLLGDSAPLRQALADNTAESEIKVAVVARTLGGRVGTETIELVKNAVAERWSRPDDLVAGLEELGIRAAARVADSSTALVAELFSFGGAVTSDAQLELALRSKLADPAAKAALVSRLLSGKAMLQTVAIVNQLVLQPRDRSIRESLRFAQQIIADESGRLLATVTTAGALAAAQLQRLRSALASRYGRELDLNLVIDPAVIGGVRVTIGDDIIDSTIAARLNDVRLQLA